ncbi:hypothetical protein Bca101_088229 [Brassica carinata]
MEIHATQPKKDDRELAKMGAKYFFEKDLLLQGLVPTNKKGDGAKTSLGQNRTLPFTISPLGDWDSRRECIVWSSWCGEMGHSCASRAVVIGRGAERTQESSASGLPLGNRTTTSNEINWFHAA